MSAESSVDGSICISSEEEDCSCVKWKSPSNANAAGIPPDVVGSCGGSSVYDSTSTRHNGHVGD